MLYGLGWHWRWWSIAGLWRWWCISSGGLYFLTDFQHWASGYGEFVVAHVFLLALVLMPRKRGLTTLASHNHLRFTKSTLDTPPEAAIFASIYPVDTEASSSLNDINDRIVRRSQNGLLLKLSRLAPSFLEIAMQRRRLPKVILFSICLISIYKGNGTRLSGTRPC